MVLGNTAIDFKTRMSRKKETRNKTFPIRKGK